MLILVSQKFLTFRINRLLMFAGVLVVLSVCTFAIPFTTSFVTLSVAAAAMGLFQVSGKFSRSFNSVKTSLFCDTCAPATATMALLEMMTLGEELQGRIVYS